MSAEVNKLPKVHRVAQRWGATCNDHSGFGHNNVLPRDGSDKAGPTPTGPWRWIQRRTKAAAMHDASRHNAEHHSTTRDHTNGSTT